MDTGYAHTVEATDPDCLRPGEAAQLLAGHPWRRFAVLGDSVAQGIGDPVDGYVNLPWTERVGTELRAAGPPVAYLNLGRRGLRAGQVRATQLDAALEFRPDLAVVAAGANDALLPGYRPDAVDAELEAMVAPLRAAGAEVLTVGLFDLANCPAVQERFRPALAGRMRILAARTRALAARLGCLHVDLTSHPAVRDVTLYSGDGLHGNGRSQGVTAAVAVRLLGARLRRHAARRPG
ncbi:MAG TPA: SGNH/GDSL hydrolase family protein [Micromonospora sp.]